MSINSKALKNELFETIFISAITSIFESSVKFIESSKSFAVTTLFISTETSKSKNRVFTSIDELISFFKQSKQSQSKISRRTSILTKLFLELSLSQLNNFKNSNTSKSSVVIDHQKKMFSKTIQIFDFHEYFSKNSSRWFRLIEIQHFAQMQLSKQNKKTFQCYTVMFKTKENAIKWINDQKNILIENWNALKKILIERFSKKKKIETNYETTLDALYNLKQLKKFLRNYIKKARKVQKLLSKKIQNQISYKLVSKLSDDMTKRIMRDIIAQKKSNAYDFETTIRLVKSIAKNQNKKNSIAKQQREMNSRNRMFASILN